MLSLLATPFLSYKQISTNQRKISTSTKKSPLAQIFTRRPTHCCHRLTHTEPSVLCCVNALAHSQSPPLAPGKELVISLLPAALQWFTNPLIGAIRPISGFERFRLRGKEWSTIEDGCRGKVVHDEHIKDGNWWVKTCDFSAGFLWLQLDQASQNYSQDTLGSWSIAAEKPKVPNKVFHTQHVVHFLLPETVRREKEDTVTQLQCKMTSHLETEREQCRHWEKLQQLVLPQELFWRGYFVLLISNLRGGAWCWLNSFKILNLLNPLAGSVKHTDLYVILHLQRAKMPILTLFQNIATINFFSSSVVQIEKRSKTFLCIFSCIYFFRTKIQMGCLQIHCFFLCVFHRLVSLMTLAKRWFQMFHLLKSELRSEMGKIFNLCHLQLEVNFAFTIWELLSRNLCELSFLDSQTRISLYHCTKWKHFSCEEVFITLTQNFRVTVGINSNITWNN